MKRLLVPFFLLLLFSCSQKKSVKEVPVPADSTGIITDNSGPVEKGPKPGSETVPGIPGLAPAVNAIMKKKSGDQWMVVTDSVAQWPKDEFDYFIASKRKQDPDYPYIAKGDYNGDGKADLAALVNKPGSREFRVMIIGDYNSGSPAFNSWNQDIDVCAVSNFPRGELNGIKGEKIKMKADAVGIEYFEKSSFVLYWNGSAFKRVWTGD